jgi:hypothetical protein
MAQLISWVNAEWSSVDAGYDMNPGDLHQIILWGGGLTERDVVTFTCHPTVVPFTDEETVLQATVQAELGNDGARRIFVWVRNVGPNSIYGYYINGMLLRP